MAPPMDSVYSRTAPLRANERCLSSWASSAWRACTAGIPCDFSKASSTVAIAVSTSAAAGSEIFARLRRKSRAALRRSDFASLRARLRTPQGVADPMVESRKTARNTQSEPRRKSCRRSRCCATTAIATVPPTIPRSFP